MVTFDKQKITAALQDFYNATGIDMDLLKADFSPVDRYRTTNSCYCSLIQSCPKGKEACPARQIPEEELYRVTSEVLGLAEFDADTLHSKITAMRAENDCTLVFTLADGTECVKRWIPRSRRNSWTPEMKERARQRTLERGNRECQQQSQ